MRSEKHTTTPGIVLDMRLYTFDIVPVGIVLAFWWCDYVPSIMYRLLAYHGWFSQQEGADQ